MVDFFHRFYHPNDYNPNDNLWELSTYAELN